MSSSDYLWFKRVYLLILSIALIMPFFDFYFNYSIVQYLQSVIDTLEFEPENLDWGYYHSLYGFYSNSFLIFFAFDWTRAILTILARINLHRYKFGPIIKYNWISFILSMIHIGMISASLISFMFIQFYFFLPLPILILTFNLKMRRSYRSFDHKEESLIKKKILDLSTQYLQLELQDVAEKCYINQEKIKIVLLEMINNKEVHVDFSKNTNIIQFDQDLNIEEIDTLMGLYEEWERGKIKKKIE